MASFVPDAVHRLPDVGAGVGRALVEADPRISPFTSDVNFTPSSVDEGSPSSALRGVTDAGKIVHALQLMAAGVTGFEAAEPGPVPTALVAVTVKV